MSFHDVLVLEDFVAHVTFERLDVTNTMNGCHVRLHVPRLDELPAANFALVPGVWVLWSASAATAAAPRMRLGVVSIERLLVA